MYELTYRKFERGGPTFFKYTQMQSILILSSFVCVLLEFFYSFKPLFWCFSQSYDYLISAKIAWPSSFKISVFLSTETKQNIFFNISVFFVFTWVHWFVFISTFNLICFPAAIVFRLKRPKILLEMRESEAIFGTVFKRLGFYLTAIRTGNGAFSSAFSIRIAWTIGENALKSVRY